MERASTALRGAGGVQDASSVVDGQLRVVLRADGGRRRDEDGANELLRRLMDAGVPVLGFEIEGSRLADVFMELTDEGAA
jgi:hypothetical protein